MQNPVRIARESDAAAIAAIYAPYVRDTTISFEETPPSSEEMAGRMRLLLPTHPYLVMDGPDGVIGYAYAGPHGERAAYRWSVDVSVYVAAQAHQLGVGRALYTELFGVLVRQGFHAAFAGIALPNPKSVAFHERMGFTHLGSFAEVGFKHGAWLDVGWWERRLGVATTAPAEPTPFSAFAGA
jgi:phosphinothricin acetyltransferase